MKKFVSSVTAYYRNADKLAANTMRRAFNNVTKSYNGEEYQNLIELFPTLDTNHVTIISESGRAFSARIHNIPKMPVVNFEETRKVFTENDLKIINIEHLKIIQGQNVVQIDFVPNTSDFKVSVNSKK